MRIRRDRRFLQGAVLERKNGTTQPRAAGWILRGLSTICLVVMTATVVLAVVGTGIDNGAFFELDGNASVQSTHDWNQVYADSLNKTNTAQAIAAAFVTDGFGAGDDILTGGSTKDPLDFPGWLWKQNNTTSVQDKDDLEHVFAAAYTLSNGHTGIFFGSDRFSNSGDSQMGFWFLQDPTVAINNNAHGGASVGFNVKHMVGDLLIVAHFVNGGAVPQITLFTWVGGSAGIQQVGSVDNNLCNPSTGSVPDICAITNVAAAGQSWSFTEKASDNPGVSGTFMEGGIDLQNALGSSPCFNVFFAETRSSQTPSSTLSDFTKPVPFVLCSIDASKSCSSASILTNSNTGANTVHYTFTGAVTAPQANAWDATITDTFPAGAANTHLGSGSDPSVAPACTPVNGACTITIPGVIASGGPGVSYSGSFDMTAPLPASDATHPNGTNPNQMTATAAPGSGGPQTVSLSGANFRLWAANDSAGQGCHLSFGSNLTLAKGCAVNLVLPGQPGNTTSDIILQVQTEIRICSTVPVSQGGVQVKGINIVDNVIGSIASNLSLNAPTGATPNCIHYYPTYNPSTCASTDGRCSFTDTASVVGTTPANVDCSTNPTAAGCPVDDFGNHVSAPLPQSATCRVCPSGACSGSSDTPFPDPLGTKP